MIGALTLALTILSAIAAILYVIINDPEDRGAIAAWLERAPLWEGYRRGVGWGLERLERFYGGSFSPRAFDRCFLIASYYPIILYVAAWVVGSSAAPLDEFQLPKDSSWWQRLIALFVFLCLVVSTAALFWKRDWINNAVQEMALRLRDWSGLSRKGGWIFFGAAVSVAGVFAYLAVDHWFLASVVALAGFFSIIRRAAVSIALLVVLTAMILSIQVDFTYLVILSIVLFLIIANEVGSVFFFIFFVLVLITILSTVFEIGQYGVIVGWAFFMVLLPFVNGVADYLSFGVSRKLLQAVADDADHWRLARHVGYDITLAFIFLFLLAGILLSGTAFYAQQVVSWVDADIAWQPFLQAARDDPFGGGLPVTVMLFSTLIPTFAHLLVAAVAILVRPLPGQHMIMAWLAVEGEIQTSRKIGAVAWMMTAVIGGLAGLSAVGYGVWTLFSFLTGDTIGDYLYAYATCFASLVSNLTCLTP